MKVYLDDERNTPEGWERVNTVGNLISIINKHGEDIEIISLDHDLGEGEETGYDFLEWFEEMIFFGKIAHIPEIVIHSANPVGRMNMEMAITIIKRLRESNGTRSSQ